MFNINVSTGSSIVSIVNCGMSLLGTFKTFMDIQGSGSTTVSMANTKLAWSPFVNADNFLHLRGVNNSVSITDFGLINQGFVTNLFRVNDGSTLNLYHNGLLVDSTSVSISITYSASYPLYIGSYGGTDFPMRGFINSAQLYSRALTANEIKQNFDTFKTRFDLSGTGTTSGVEVPL